MNVKTFRKEYNKNRISIGCVGAAVSCTQACCGILVLLFYICMWGFFCSPEYFVIGEEEFVPFVSFNEQNLLFSEAAIPIPAPSILRKDECLLCRSNSQCHTPVLLVWFSALSAPFFLCPSSPFSKLESSRTLLQCPMFLTVPEGAHSWSRGTRLDLHGPWRSMVKGLAAISASLPCLPFHCLWLMLSETTV